MKNEFRLLVVPDLHGRNFWKAPCDQIDDYDKVIFLGDYVDPYPHEEIPKEMAITTLGDIINLKKDYQDKVVLLLGNHDCGYAVSTNVSCSRHDAVNADRLIDLFLSNRSLFQLAYETDVNDRHFVFSHAGIRRRWFEVTGFSNYDLAVDYLNNSYCGQDHRLESLLSMVSYYRWGYYDYGSVVWADVGEWLREDKSDYPPRTYHVFGHSQQKTDPIITDWWACLDCRRAFEVRGDKAL